MLIRRSADLGWKRKDLKHTRTRMVKHKDVCTITIVPGGRWLLAGDLNANLLVYDLHASSLVGRAFIPQDPVNRWVNLIEIDIDSDRAPTQNLSFTMAVSAVLQSCKEFVIVIQSL